MAIYPDTFENKIGFDRIRIFLTERCLCNLGRERVFEMKFLSEFSALKEILFITEEMRNIMVFEENFPQDDYVDARANIQKMKIEGSVPEENDLLLIFKSLSAIYKLVKFFSESEKKEKYPRLSMLASQVNKFPQVLNEIDRILDKSGLVKDSASPKLKELRISIKQKQAEANKKLQQILRKAKSDGIVEDDAEITFRNNRPVIPVNVSSKRVLGGMMHDESASGKTAFIEPAECVEINNKIREYQIQESREIKRILQAFADFIRPFIDDLTGSYYFLGEIDFARSKANFAKEINAMLPILNEKCGFSWHNAVHPLLYLTHTRDGKEIVPLTINLDEENRILVISGPNAGGKSVCLKTVGLLQYMLQCGMLVPMKENSEVGFFESIFIDIGDEQSIDNDLSTYSGHIVNMKHFVRYANSGTLVLIDEFGTGTEPVLGGAIAEAVLEKLHSQQVFAVITTHYANLKHFASENQGIVNGAMLFDTQSIQPLYKLSIGRPGSSFAIDIARKIGLPSEILEKASEKIGQEHFNYDKQLREIARDKKYWEEKRQRIRKVEKTLDNLYARYNNELEDIQKERKKILAEAKKEAEQLLKDANKQIERTVREIKEANAEKALTQQIREDFKAYSDKNIKAEGVENKFENKIREIKHVGQKLVNNSPELKKSKVEQQKKEKVKTKELEPGDVVKIKGMDSVGEIIKIDSRQVTIAFGNLLSTVSISKVVLSEEVQLPKKSQGVKVDAGIKEKKLNFKPEIDLRGKRADEALHRVQQFLDEAVIAGVGELLILHGKGNGILRQLIRDYLATVNFVSNAKDAHADRGGAGITIVTLDY